MTGEGMMCDRRHDYEERRVFEKQKNNEDESRCWNARTAQP